MAEQPAEKAQREPLGIVVCYTKCWACQFGEHDAEWHTWADPDDVAHAAATGQADPSSVRCGCYCCRDAERTSPPGRADS